MFPVAICVATAAMLSGIGGAALFIPIFVIIFPLLGPEYPLAISAAIGSALMTEVFGFSSGFIGYYRKRLIDFSSVVPGPVTVRLSCFEHTLVSTTMHGQGNVPHRLE